MPEIEPRPRDAHDALALFPYCDFARLGKNIERKMDIRIGIQSPCVEVSAHKLVTAPTAAEINELLRRGRFFWRVGEQFPWNPSLPRCWGSQFGADVCERECSEPRVVRQTSKECCVDGKLVRSCPVHDESAVHSRGRYERHEKTRRSENDASVAKHILLELCTLLKGCPQPS